MSLPHICSNLRRIRGLWCFAFGVWGILFSISDGWASSDEGYLEPGVPAYRIYDLRDLGTGFRTACFSKDKLGRLLLLSGGKLWTFDGSEWQKLLDSHDNAVFSGISVADDGTIYIGASSDWGYLVNVDGSGYKYRSLKQSNLPNHILSTGDYFDVQTYGTRVGFMGENSIVLKESDGSYHVYDGFYHLTTQFELGDTIYVSTEAEGLFKIGNGEVQPVSLDWSGLKGDGAGVITASCQMKDGSVILAVSGVGLVSYDGKQMTRIETHFQALTSQRILDVLAFDDGSIAVALDEWGLAILDRGGYPIRMISKDAERQFIRVRNLHDNGDGTLWVTVANGIAKVIQPSALAFYGHQLNLPLFWPSAYRYEGKLIIQSNRSIYEGIYDGEKQLIRFEPIISLVEHPLMDTAYPVDKEGIFISDDNKLFLQPQKGELYKIADDLPVRYFHRHPDRPDVIFLLNHEGVYTIEKRDDGWVYSGNFLAAKGIFNQVHVRDRDGKFWSERGPGKLLQYWLDSEGNLNGRVFDEKNGLGEQWIALYSIGGEVCASFGSHQVRYDSMTDLFVENPVMERVESIIGKNITRPYEYAPHQLIVTTSQGVVLVDISDPENPRFDYHTFAAFPEFNPMVLTDIQGEIWLRTEISLVRFRPDQVYSSDCKTRVVIDRISVPGSDASLPINPVSPESEPSVRTVFPYRKSGLQFHFFPTCDVQLNPLGYRYFLKGLTKDWSEVSTHTTAYFVGIPEGNYTLIVEPVDHFGRSGKATEFPFTIRPPWYRDRLAFVSYFVVFLGVILTIIFSIRNNAKRDKLRLEKLVADKTVEYEKAASDAMEASRAKSQFLANMSHEIRTPINGIIGTGELLENSGLNHEQMDLVSIVRSSANSLLEVIEDILSFSKIEAGRIELREEEFLLEDLLLECLRVISDRSMRKRIGIFYTVKGSGNYEIRADKGRIKQILINLLENALKFTNQGYVQIDCEVDPASDEKSGAKLRVEVTDTGIGIEEEKLGNLFIPFSQIDSSNTRHYEGSGLGLSICKGLVERLGGSIHIESVIGKGTSVSFGIPVQLLKTLETLPQISGEKMPESIWWIDPDMERCKALAKVLREKGVRVISLPGAASALDQLRNRAMPPPDYLILEQEDSRAFGELTGLMLESYRRGQCCGFTIISFPDIHFSESLTPHVVFKPWSFTALFCHVKAIYSHHNPETAYGLQKPTEQLTLDGLKDRRVMIVEDNKVNHKVLDLILRKSGIRADHAWNGVEACRMSAQVHYDLVLMDVQMPEMDGLEATTRIKESSPETYVIGISASVQETDRQTAINSQMDDYLTKPVRQKELAGAVAKYFQKVT